MYIRFTVRRQISDGVTEFTSLWEKKEKRVKKKTKHTIVSIEPTFFFIITITLLAHFFRSISFYACFHFIDWVRFRCAGDGRLLAQNFAKGTKDQLNIFKYLYWTKRNGIEVAIKIMCGECGFIKKKYLYIYICISTTKPIWYLTNDDDDDDDNNNRKKKHKIKSMKIDTHNIRVPLIVKTHTSSGDGDRRHTKPISILSNRCAFFLNISSNSIVLTARQALKTAQCLQKLSTYEIKKNKNFQKSSKDTQKLSEMSVSEKSMKVLY